MEKTFFLQNFIQLTLTPGSLSDTDPTQQEQRPEVSFKIKYINFYYKQPTLVFVQIQYPLFPSSIKIFCIHFFKQK